MKKVIIGGRNISMASFLAMSHSEVVELNIIPQDKEPIPPKLELISRDYIYPPKSSQQKRRERRAEARRNKKRKRSNR